MFSGNPHAPSTSWLNSVAHPHGGYNEAEPGHEGTELLERDGKVFEVTVRRVPPDGPPKSPIRTWVIDNWHRLRLADDADAEEVTEAIVAAIEEANDES